MAEELDRYPPGTDSTDEGIYPPIIITTKAKTMISDWMCHTLIVAITLDLLRDFVVVAEQEVSFQTIPPWLFCIVLHAIHPSLPSLWRTTL